MSSTPLDHKQFSTESQNSFTMTKPSNFKSLYTNVPQRRNIVNYSLVSQHARLKKRDILLGCVTHSNYGKDGNDTNNVCLLGCSKG